MWSSISFLLNSIENGLVQFPPHCTFGKLLLLFYPGHHDYVVTSFWYYLTAIETSLKLLTLNCRIRSQFFVHSGIVLHEKPKQCSYFVRILHACKTFAYSWICLHTLDAQWHMSHCLTLALALVHHPNSVTTCTLTKVLVFTNHGVYCVTEENKLCVCV